MGADLLTRDNWRISEELGNPVAESQKLWETVRDELGKTEISFPRLMAAAHLMLRWKETKNPYFIDAAMLVCESERVKPTDAIVAEMVKAASLRITGSPAGTPERVLKEGLQDKLLTLMMNLVAAGFSLRMAARKAQAWQKQGAPKVNSYKASGLERAYTEKMRNTGIEDHFMKHVDKWGEWHASAWLEIGNAMPASGEHESGERR